MKRILPLLVLLLYLAGTGCNSLTSKAIEPSQSGFLAQFSLQKTVANVSTPGLDCSKLQPPELPSMPSPSPNSDRLSNSQLYVAFCEIERIEQFQEAGFIQSISSEVERQIQSTGAQVQGSTKFGSKGFQVEYEAEKIKGKVKMSVEKQESNYIVKIEIEESD